MPHEIAIRDNKDDQRIADALCKAAARGVKVRILVDGIGSLTWGGAITHQLEKAGILTRVFHPLPWKISHWHRSADGVNFLFPKLMYLLSHINARNHAKVCIIDGSTVFVGSANLGIHLVDDAVSGKKWRETSVKLSGVDVCEIQYAFNKAFGAMRFSQRFRARLRPPINHSPFCLNATWRSRHRFNQAILKRIANARQRIWVMNAYFVPNAFLLKALIKASRRGLDVRILLPAKSDLFLMPLASATFYNILLANDIVLHEYLPTILHAKTLIIDDWYLLGSSNLNNRSLKHDLEVNVTIETDQARKTIEQQFLKDLDQSKKLQKKEVAKFSLGKRFIAQCILLLKYWL